MYTLDFLQCDQLISACLCAVTSVQELTDLTLRAVHARAACAVLLATPSVQDVKLPIPFLTSHNMIYIYIYICMYLSARERCSASTQTAAALGQLQRTRSCGFVSASIRTGCTRSSSADSHNLQWRTFKIQCEANIKQFQTTAA